MIHQKAQYLDKRWSKLYLSMMGRLLTAAKRNPESKEVVAQFFDLSNQMTALIEFLSEDFTAVDTLKAEKEEKEKAEKEKEREEQKAKRQAGKPA